MPPFCSPLNPLLRKYATEKIKEKKMWPKYQQFERNKIENIKNYDTIVNIETDKTTIK